MCSFSKKRHIPGLKLRILKIGFFGPKIFFQEKLVMRYLSTHKSSHFIIGFSSQLKMNENFENRSECMQIRLKNVWKMGVIDASEQSAAEPE